MSDARATRRALLLVACLGLFHLFTLPPFEGFDETAHYSSVAQIAATGAPPILGRAFIAREVEDYRASAPLPYASEPPFDDNGGLTYRRFREADGTAEALQRPFAGFAPSSEANWQAQHPPLFHALMAPLALATADQTLTARLLILRLASFGLALAALAVAAAANGRLLPGGALATALWPLLLPGWVPEMARLGNDSLCALLLALAWYGVCLILAGDGRRRWWWLTGIALGLGCMTKGLVPPVALGIALLLAWKRLRMARAADWLAFLAPLLVLGAPWYLWHLAQGIPLTNDALIVTRGDGVWAGLGAHFSLAGLAQGLAAMLKSFVWPGSWSFIRPHWALHVPILLIVGAIALGWLGALRRDRALALAPLFPLLPLLAGLVWHVLLWQSQGRYTVIGGWYLHVLAGPLALIAALAWRSARPRATQIAQGAMAYGAAFLVGATLLQSVVFAGCVHRAGLDPTILVDWECALDFPGVAERLTVLAFPLPAAAFLLLAAVAAPGLWRAAGVSRS